MIRFIVCFSLSFLVFESRGEVSGCDREGLLKSFAPFVGHYDGLLKPSAHWVRPNNFSVETWTNGIKVFVNVVISEVPTADGDDTCPKLSGYFQWNTSPWDEGTGTTLRVIFDSKVVPTKAVMYSDQTGGNGYFVTLRGTFKDRTLEGVFTNQRGATGTYVLRADDAAESISTR